MLLVVVAGDDELTWKSLRNVPGVHLLDSGQLNTYDVLVSDHVVFTQAALDQFLARSGFPGVVQSEPAESPSRHAHRPQPDEAEEAEDAS